MPTNKQPLRICYISDERFPSHWTDTQQIMKTASALAEAGASVDVVLPRKWGVLFSSKGQRKAILENYYGIKAAFELTQIVTVPVGRWRLEKLTHGMAAALYSVFGKHDLVYTRNVLPLVLALFLGKYVVFESHRILQKHYKFTYKVIRAIRRHPRFLGIVTNAQFISRGYEEMGFASDRVFLAHNSFDPEDMQPVLTKAEARTRLQLELNKGIVCYAGHIQRRKGIETVIDIAASTPELLYLVCGGSAAEVQEAEAIAKQKGTQNLKFVGWVKVSELSKYLYAADVLLIPPARAPLERHGNTVMPIKTYSYLSIGRVIVAPRLPDIVEVLHDGENSLLVEPDQPQEAATVIRSAITNASLAERIGAAAHRDSLTYTWARRAESILGFLEQRLRGRAERPLRPRPEA